MRAAQSNLDVILTEGELEIVGRLVAASNATLKCVAHLDGLEVECVYKPRRGERPLWDFATGTLGLREVASYAISEAAGWDLIPSTVWRDAGPLGPGMCQLWFDADETYPAVDLIPERLVAPGWRVIVHAEDASGDRVALVHRDDPALARLCALDVVLNNADRKGGHVLVGPTDDPEAPLAERGLVGIDHGVTLHEEPKLRTVLWGWAGEELSREVVESLARLDSALASDTRLRQLLESALSRRELAGLVDRLAVLRSSGCYPYPGEDWPPLPWPAF